MKRIIILILLITIVGVEYAESQRSRRWKRFRYELVYGAGAGNFLGELGGADQVGTNFLADFEPALTRPVLHIGARYKVLERLSAKSGFYFGWLAGDDQFTLDVYRNYRNIKVRTWLVEWNNQIEYSITKEKIGHRYNLRRVRGLKNLKINIYAFTGINAFLYIPQGQYNGTYVNLRSIGTEGQGKIETRQKYSLISASIPIGFGFKYSLSRYYSVGFEYGVRKTFTDYLDDTSTTYADSEYFDTDMEKFFADPSPKEDFPARTTWTGAGAQRGDPTDKDLYMFAVISVSYKLMTGRNGLPKF